MSGIELKKTDFAGSLFGSPKRSWSRASDLPIYAHSMQAAGYEAPSLYWPWVVPMYRYLSNPLAKYYMYYSTDHDVGQGGIFLALSDSPSGPFVQYTGAPVTENYPRPGAIYQDNQGGTGTDSTGGVADTFQIQVETPSVIWDPTASIFRMFYQAGGGLGGQPVYSPDGVAKTVKGAQATLSATSFDGIVWTKDQSWALDVSTNTVTPPFAQPGDGHTGYFHPFEVDGSYFAYSLYGSGNYPRFAQHICYGDTKTWMTNDAALGYWPQMLPSDKQRLISWNHCFVHMSAEGPTLTGLATDFTSGAAPKDCRIISAPLDASLRMPRRAVDVIWTPTLAWEDANVRAVSGMRDGADLYLYYLCKTSGGDQNIGVLKYDY